MRGKSSIASPVLGYLPSKRRLALGPPVAGATEGDTDGRGVYTPVGSDSTHHRGKRRKRLGWFVVGAMVLILMTLNFASLQGSITGSDNGTLVEEEGSIRDEGSSSSLWSEEMTLRYYFQRLRSIVGGEHEKEEEGREGEKEGGTVDEETSAMTVSRLRRKKEKEAEERAAAAAAGAAAKRKAEGGVPPLPPPPPPSVIGSQVDMEAALQLTKEKIKREQEEATGRTPQQEEKEEEEEEEVVGKEKEEKEEDEKEDEKEEADNKEVATPVAAPRHIIEEKRNPAIPMVQPAGDKATRPPLSSSSSRPPLHRQASETHIQKIVLTISSTDRGQRIADLWQGDKLDTILQTLGSVKGLCERGFDLTVWFVAAWEISLEKERVDEALFCEKIGKPVETRYWDHYPADIEALLSSRHRLAMAEVFGKEGGRDGWREGGREGRREILSPSLPPSP